MNLYDSKIVVAIENAVCNQLEASGITADPFRLDGEKIIDVILEQIEGFVLVPKEPNDKITFSVLDDIFSCSFCYDDPSSWKMAYKKLIDGVSKTVIEAQEQSHD
ncbi:hypothetical protein F7P73_14850 [Acinetobacter bohemicus]|uniref:Uncharacterized protein n=1 Tax=Acinetobacter bohemicus TaxID=1435036 RepID=A0A1I6VV48_9GAMM|nr:hypothetical protein [Acinetobacter bohemicus]KAB0650995.1 hypothetical protein F7P73_14850 [Acinetobacter bohemicus]SFT17577.1 hypothetical protein SAMN05444586_103331 [Acinetobacter bohemicus]